MILLPVLRFAYSFTVSVKSNRDPKAAVRFWWQGQKESNPQPTVLETVALPIELYPFSRGGPFRSAANSFQNYSMTAATTPAPTV